MEIITKAAARSDAFQAPTLFYRSAREGFGDFLGSLNLEDDEGILLPAFIGWSPREGSGVFDPVTESGLPYGFYEPRPDLTIDLGRLETALKTGRWRVLVVIHYWGRTEPRLAEIRALADRYRAILVEDLAHGFYSAMQGIAGQSGSVNLFSLHKMFPLREGGMVGYRDPALLKSQRETRPDLARRILDYDWAAIGAVRRENFQRLKEQLAILPELGTHFDLIWPELAPGDVPQSLPVKILTGHRDHVYSTMNAAGYGMTSLYHTLLEPLASDFPAMRALAGSITNFPIHQDCDPAAFDGMITAFRAALR